MVGCENSSHAPQRATLRDTLYTSDELERREQASRDNEILVMVMGNSLTAGFGLASEEEAFPALIQQTIDSLGWNVEVVNAGVSGQTSSGGLGRIDWVLQQPVDVLILELGGNDGLRGIDPEVTKGNLQAIIGSTKAQYPDARIILAGVRMPPNLGSQYARRAYSIYPELAQENDLVFIPYLMDDVAGNPRLMQPDGIHPTAAGQRIMAETVWEKLKPVLGELREVVRG